MTNQATRPRATRSPAPGRGPVRSGHQVTGRGPRARSPGPRITAHQALTWERITAHVLINLGANNCAPGTTATGPAGAAQVTRSTGHQARPVQRGPRNCAPGLGFLRSPAAPRSGKTLRGKRCGHSIRRAGFDVKRGADHAPGLRPGTRAARCMRAG